MSTIDASREQCGRRPYPRLTQVYRWESRAPEPLSLPFSVPFLRVGMVTQTKKAPTWVGANKNRVIEPGAVEKVPSPPRVRLLADSVQQVIQSSPALLRNPPLA